MCNFLYYLGLNWVSENQARDSFEENWPQISSVTPSKWQFLEIWRVVEISKAHCQSISRNSPTRSSSNRHDSWRTFESTIWRIKGVHRRWLNIVSFDFEYKAQRYDANAFHLGCEFIINLKRVPNYAYIFSDITHLREVFLMKNHKEVATSLDVLSFIALQNK